MKITESVILDLMPLYLAKEASEDSAEIIKTYLKTNPEFARKIKTQTLGLELFEITGDINMDEEMVTLQKTKSRVRMRSIIMGFAIFLSALPLSFGSVSWDNYDGVHWLWSDNPTLAVFIGVVGLGFWTVYYFLNRRLSI